MGPAADKRAKQPSALLFGTSNPGKKREILGLLHDLPLKLLFLTDVGNPPCVEETGSTFKENALLKARGYAPLLPGGFIAAEDSGLVAPALGGEPGVYSARFGGLDGSVERNRLLIERMKGFSGEDRAVYYEAVVALIEPGGTESFFSGRVHGYLTDAPMGHGGFGYDPLFFHPELGTTFGCLSSARKAGYSHRGKALRALKTYLTGRMTP